MKMVSAMEPYVGRKRVRSRDLSPHLTSLITTAVLCFRGQVSTQQVQDKLPVPTQCRIQLQGQGLRAGMKESDISQVAQVEELQTFSIAIRRIRPSLIQPSHSGPTSRTA